MKMIGRTVFLLSVTTAFLTACSTPTVSDDDSSESSKDVSQKYAEAKVMPSGTFDCTKYKCFMTDLLNQEFLEAGKYGEILDERDNRVYKTVQIGDQTWMAENLDYETKSSWCGGGSGKTEGICSIYGRFYTWAAAMGKSESKCGLGYDCTTLGTGNVQGVCPAGWHVPTQSEWIDLFAAVGGDDIAGSKLKTQTDWTFYSGITNEDAVGFSALPAGNRLNNENFNDVSYGASFWSATQGDGYHAYYMHLSFRSDGARLLFYLDNARVRNGNKDYGFSVRCLKD